jgi:hypothetical protein
MSCLRYHEAMDYLIEVRDTGDSMQLAEEDWSYLLILAGTFGWKPVAVLAYYLSVPPPDIIPVSISRHLAETLNRIVPTLPERSGPINVSLPQEGGVVHVPAKLLWRRT